MKKTYLIAGLALSLAILSCNNSSNNQQTKDSDSTAIVNIQEEVVSYTNGDATYKGWIACNAADSGKRPAVLVVPEWWGLNDYAKMRARKLADLGYIAMAIDMYGNGKLAATPDSAKKYASPFYSDPQLAKSVFDAALTALKNYPQADTTQIAAIGYCFGGAQVLNMARLGENLKGVVSFHGNLVGTPADKNLLKAKILVCHGDADPFVKPEEVALFKKQMDSIGADYTFKHYAGATHAFTNPDATATGKKFNMPVEYNAAADSASWEDMKQFFRRIF